MPKWMLHKDTIEQRHCEVVHYKPKLPSDQTAAFFLIVYLDSVDTEGLFLNTAVNVFAETQFKISIS